MLNRLHLITGAADATGYARVSPGTAGNSFVNRPAFVFIALQART